MKRGRIVHRNLSYRAAGAASCRLRSQGAAMWLPCLLPQKPPSSKSQSRKVRSCPGLSKVGWLSSRERRAASAARSRSIWPGPAPTWWRSPGPRARSRSSTTPSAKPAARPRWCLATQGFRRARPARRRDPRTLGKARHSGRQRRPPGTDHAARPCRPQAMGRRDGRQRHGQLAPDPLARSLAARLGRGARRADLVRRRPPQPSFGPIGAPTPFPRRHSTRWRGPMRPKPRPPRP